MGMLLVFEAEPSAELNVLIISRIATAFKTAAAVISAER
jgi:hypothetical protein